MNRIFELWVGDQESGKTFQIRRRVGALRKRCSIHMIAFADRIGEFGDMGEVFKDMGDFNARFRDDLPRVAVFQMGLSRESYFPLWELLEVEGDCLGVIDEAREVAPSGSSWRGGPALERIALAGRHLPDASGELRPTHLIVATQYPRSIHISMREQARTVMVGHLSGENAWDWVRGEFGLEALERVQRLKMHEWTCVKGRDPR